MKYPFFRGSRHIDNYPPQAIHLGCRTGTDFLLDYLQQLTNIGVNHVALNLRFNQLDITETLHALAQKVLPHFH